MQGMIVLLLEILGSAGASLSFEVRFSDFVRVKQQPIV